MTYKKQTVNEFLAFKGLFDRELSEAIETENKEVMQHILENKYDYELENNFFVNVPINTHTIKSLHKLHISELENDPSLKFKL